MGPISKDGLLRLISKGWYGLLVGLAVACLVCGAVLLFWFRAAIILIGAGAAVMMMLSSLGCKEKSSG